MIYLLINYYIIVPDMMKREMLLYIAKTWIDELLLFCILQIIIFWLPDSVFFISEVSVNTAMYAAPGIWFILTP